MVLGTFSSRGQKATTVGYVAGDRSLGLLLMYFITGATIFSAFAFLGLPGGAYSRGSLCLPPSGDGDASQKHTSCKPT
ncbi:MAG: hypothetical protein KC619_04000 [Myxococcales bacterium]|nr:hypothetical protein [Myxococcales bacterium]